MNAKSESIQGFRIPHVVQFFLLTYLINWAIWGLLICFPETMGEMYFLVIFGPFAATAILTRVHQGKDEAKIGVRMLYDCVQESAGIFWVVWESHY